MAAKEIKYDAVAREKIMKGVETLAGAVKVTLGPKGATWSSQNPGAPRQSPKMASRWRRK